MQNTTDKMVDGFPKGILVGMIITSIIVTGFWVMFIKIIEQKHVNDVLTKTMKTKEQLLTKAKCPESPFMEITVLTLDGGSYKCGAVRTIPVHAKELERWYKNEAKRLLKAEKKS